MTETMEEHRKARRLAAAKDMVQVLATEGAIESADWLQWVVRVQTNLTEDERKGLIWLLLHTFTADKAEEVAAAAFPAAGWPKASLMADPLQDARLWAEEANPNEIRGYAMACVEMMRPETLRKFIKWAEGRANG